MGPTVPGGTRRRPHFTGRARLALARAHPAKLLSSADRRVRRWLVSTALLALCASWSSGASPWLQAAAGAFHPPDLAQDIAAGQAIAAGLDPYGANFPAWHARVMDVPSDQGYPYLPHPPFALLLTLPFAFQSLESAALAWF